jgi:2-iminobutanoate/2-iminopropanoate deaminase
MNIINTPNAPAAIGPYVQAVEVNNFIYTSGQLGIDVSTGKLVEGINDQTHCSLKNLTAILNENNMTLENVIKTTVFVKDLNDFATVNEIYKNYFENHFPARSCVQVAKLPLDGLVEIEAIAVKNN